MKRFVKKVLAFLFIMAVVDVCCGFAGRFIQTHAKGGATARNEFINKKMDMDLVLLGSSRCVHHYSPSVFEKTLALRCYNAGSDGNGIISQYAR